MTSSPLVSGETTSLTSLSSFEITAGFSAGVLLLSVVVLVPGTRGFKPVVVVVTLRVVAKEREYD